MSAWVLCAFKRMARLVRNCPEGGAGSCFAQVATFGTSPGSRFGSPPFFLPIEAPIVLANPATGALARSLWQRVPRRPTEPLPHPPPPHTHTLCLSICLSFSLSLCLSVSLFLAGETLHNKYQISGAIVIMRRGVVSFSVKASNAFQARLWLRARRCPPQ